MKVKMHFKYGLWKHADLEVEFDKPEDFEKIIKHVNFDFHLT